MLVQKTAVLEKLEGKQAVLRLENGQVLLVLKDELLGGAKAGPEGSSLIEGEVYVVQVLTKEEAELSQSQLAESLLNQILKPNDE